MTLTIAFAHAHSPYAAACGASETGGYIVERNHNIRTGKPLVRAVLAVNVAFKTKDAAKAWVAGWDQ